MHFGSYLLSPRFLFLHTDSSRVRITPGDLCVSIVGTFEKSRCFYNLVHGRTVSESTSQKETFISLLNLMHFALGQPFSVGKKKKRKKSLLCAAVIFFSILSRLHSEFHFSSWIRHLLFFTKGTSEMIKHKIHFKYSGFSGYIRLAVWPHLVCVCPQSY